MISESETEKYFQKLIEKFKKDPPYKEKQEFGRMLMKHIDNFSPEEVERYNELKKLIS